MNKSDIQSKFEEKDWLQIYINQRARRDERKRKENSSARSSYIVNEIKGQTRRYVFGLQAIKVRH